jgi:DNA-binding IclR family transcriptional regulator
MQAIERTFAILRVIARHDGELGVSRIGEQLDLPKSTISRFLVALEAEGVVMRSSQNRFSLGAGLMQLTRPRSLHQMLVHISRPELLALSQKTDEAVGLSVLDGCNVTYIDHIASRHTVQVVDWTGRSAPLHVTSSGKLLLAFSSVEFIDAYLDQSLEPFTTHTTDSADELRAQLGNIRAQGFAVSDEEFAYDVLGYAAPISAVTGTTLAAITLYGPKYRLSELGKRHDLVTLLRSCCMAIEEELHCLLGQ